MAHLEFGRDRLAQPLPLQALELALSQYIIYIYCFLVITWVGSCLAIDPDGYRSTRIVHPDGKFALKVPRVKPSDQPALYVIGANGRAPYKQLLATDDPPTNLTIPH